MLQLPTVSVPRKKLHVPQRDFPQGMSPEAGTSCTIFWVQPQSPQRFKGKGIGPLLKGMRVKEFLVTFNLLWFLILQISFQSFLPQKIILPVTYVKNTGSNLDSFSLTAHFRKTCQLYLWNMFIICVLITTHHYYPGIRCQHLCPWQLKNFHIP